MASGRAKEFRAERKAGDVTVTLRALNGLPIEGVMSAGGLPVEPDPRGDPTEVTWRLPVADGRYVLYGIITPLVTVKWSKLVYERSVRQDSRLCWSYAKNPERIPTRRLSEGEWLGTPEIIEIKVR